MVRLEDFEDRGSGVSDVLLIYVIEGRPRGDGDVGEGRGGDDSGLRGSEGHFTYTISSTLEDCSNVETYYCLWQAVGDDLMFEVEVIDPKDNQGEVEQEEH